MKRFFCRQFPCSPSGIAPRATGTGQSQASGLRAMPQDAQLRTSFRMRTTSSRFKTLPLDTTLPSTTSAGVVITP